VKEAFFLVEKDAQGKSLLSATLFGNKRGFNFSETKAPPSEGFGEASCNAKKMRRESYYIINPIRIIEEFPK
jgi:hypothetical protein